MGWGRGWVFELGNPEGRGLKEFWKSRWMGGGGVKKSYLSWESGSVSVVGVWIFFRNNPLLYSLIVVVITLHISVLPSLLFNNIIHVFMKATCIPTICVKLVVISD